MLTTTTVDEILEKAATLTAEQRQELIRRLEAQSTPFPENKKSASPNIEWLKAHRREVAGMHVALQDGELVGQGKTLREANEVAQQNGAIKPLLTYVPREDEELWGGW